VIPFSAPFSTSPRTDFFHVPNFLLRSSSLSLASPYHPLFPSSRPRKLSAPFADVLSPISNVPPPHPLLLSLFLRTGCVQRLPVRRRRRDSDVSLSYCRAPLPAFSSSFLSLFYFMTARAKRPFLESDAPFFFLREIGGIKNLRIFPVSFPSFASSFPWTTTSNTVLIRFRDCGFSFPLPRRVSFPLSPSTFRRFRAGGPRDSLSLLHPQFFCPHKVFSHANSRGVFRSTAG